MERAPERQCGVGLSYAIPSPGLEIARGCRDCGRSCKARALGGHPTPRLAPRVRARLRRRRLPRQ
eukprot:8981250-Lingulodinium_polyedra.AAC.1